MSITYEEALNTLTAMFSDRWDEDSLDTVLRHFEGHMENTVDAVLAHGDAPPSELVRRLEASRTGASISEMDAELARQLADQEESSARAGSTNAHRAAGGGSIPPALRRVDPSNRPSERTAARSSTGENEKQGRGIPTRLPPDFLRIPGMEDTYVSSDEALARMLQDKLFAEEIKNNPEFAHLARGGGMRRSGIGGVGSNGAAKRNNAEPQVLKALSEMGEQAKKRFQDLALKFKQKLDQQNNPSGTTYGSRAGASERRGLLDIHDDDDEQEISFVGGSGTHEMKAMDTGFAMRGTSRYGKKDD